MRRRSPKYRGSNEKVAMAAGMVRAAVVLSIVGLGGGAGISQAAAQEAAGAVVGCICCAARCAWRFPPTV
jgi:hypothetical protein